MTYTARNDVPLLGIGIPDPSGRSISRFFEPQAVYQLGDDLVAVYYSASRTPANTLSCHVAAWLVDEQGDAQSNVDFAEVPIFVEFMHNASTHEVRTIGAAGLAQNLIDLVMGALPEGPGAGPIMWDHEILDQINIANAIMVAKATGPIADMPLAPGA